MASRISRLTNAEIVSACTACISAIDEHLGSSTIEIPIAGQLLKPTEVSAIFQNGIDTRAAVTTLKAQLKVAQNTRDAAEASRSQADLALKWWVNNRFGADSTESHAFGYGPRKVAVIPVETKQQAIVRNKATREARHTMGPKKKAAIKGTTVVLTSSLQPADAATTAPAVVAPVVAPVVSVAAVTTASQASADPLAGAAVTAQVAPAVVGR
jgi:hypothetical protein